MPRLIDVYRLIEKDDRLKNRQQMPFFPKDINAILLTHAHLDHSGYIPLMVKNGFKGYIYCTQASYELCKIILPESGNVACYVPTAIQYLLLCHAELVSASHRVPLLVFIRGQILN